MNSTVHEQHIISLDAAPTLAHAFHERVLRTPEALAYVQYRKGNWQEYNWRETQEQVARWQRAMKKDGLVKGDRVAIMCGNAWEWVICDQAAQGLGMVSVPIYTNDRSENIQWILQNSGARMLMVQNSTHWTTLQNIAEHLAALTRIVSLETLNSELPNLKQLDDWLEQGPFDYVLQPTQPHDLATIVYTSGTTGKPKGVMLSHHNILWNVAAALKQVKVMQHDLLLSFLPLSHTFERTAGYYLPVLTGSAVAYNRSITQLGDDLIEIQPSIMISVPRIFERVYAKIVSKVASDSAFKQKLFKLAIRLGWRRFEYQQGRSSWSPGLLIQPLLDILVGRKVRAKLGGRLRFTVCGGAALSEDISKLFIGLGIPILQGYGLTETSPIIAANLLADNVPASVGQPLPDIEVRIGTQNELLTRSPSVMLGYWNDPKATTEILDEEGWLHTGDKVAIDKKGHISITGRIKEIIVLSNGEKIPPTDMESAIALDELIDQVIVIGEGKPYLSAILVPNQEEFGKVAAHYHLDPANEETCCDENVRSIFMQHIEDRTSKFPGYAKIRQIAVVHDSWTPDNGLITPTLKLRRQRILEHHHDVTEKLYAGH